MYNAYVVGVAEALNDLGIIKVANPQVAAQIAQGASPAELQAVTDAKITEKDIESAAKIVQVIAEAKMRADEAGMTPAGTPAGQPMGQPAQDPTGMDGAPPMPPAMPQAMPQQAPPPGQPPMGVQGLGM